ncbi:MAG: PKD domain-containing protein [Crocinitomicaceae bacterium]
MKKLLLIVVLFAAGLTHAQIVADGGFENGSSGTDWTQSSTNFGTPLCDGSCGNCGGPCGANAGSWYAWFGGANAVEPASGQQSVTRPAGSSTAILSMEVFMPTPGPGLAQDRLEISMDGAILETITALDSMAYQVYTTLDLDVLSYADGNAHTLKIEGFQTSATSFNVLVDDVDIATTTAPTEANFSANQVNVSIGQPVDFTDMSSGNVTAWDWTFTGATTTSSTAENPTGIVYNTVGCYDVELTVTSPSGTDTETKTCYINVTCPPFGSFFGYSANGLVVDFTNLSLGAESYLWDFGNGNTSIAPNPIWTYTAPGTYTVTLVATDSDCAGTTDTYAINIEVALGQTSGTLSVETTEAGETIVAHPNPSNGLVQISNVIPSSEYSLINIEGKVLLTGQFENTQDLIDLSPYDEGIYYLKTNGVSLKLVKAN